MSEFIRVAAEKLPLYRQDLVNRCFTFVESTNIKEVNNFIENERNSFLKKIKTNFPNIRTKEIPEIQALIGGGETDSDTHDPEILRDILSEIENFLNEVIPQKEILQNKVRN